MKLKHWHNSQFLKDASTLTIGTTFAQVLPLLVYPVLSRLYSPDQFAVLAAFTSIITLIQVLGSGKYETAILIAHNDKSAANIMGLSIVFSIVVSIILYTIFLIFGTKFTYRFTSGLHDLILLTPICSIFLVIFNCYNEWCVRNQYFKKLALNKISNSIFVTLGKYGMYYTLLSSIGLTVGDFIGRLLSSLGCILRIYFHDRVAIKSISLKEMIRNAVTYKRFPLYTMPAQLMNSLATAAPVFILSYFYSKDVVGYFSMTMSVLLLPINVISLAVRDVFRKKANDQFRIHGEFVALYKSILKVFLIITFLFIVVVISFIPWLFNCILGSQWYEAGKYAQLLLPMIGLDFIAMSLSGVFIVTNKLKSLFLWQTCFCVTTIISLWIPSVIGGSIYLTLAIFGLGRGLTYILMLVLSYAYSKGQHNK